ncbi:MAG: 3'-5' exoribonuclease YhaM [Bacillaceae bacterium]
MKKRIYDHEVGEQLDTYALIKAVSKGTATSGRPYLTITLQDQSGEIDAKLWDAKPQDEENYVPQTIVKVVAEMQSYRQRAQLKILNMRVTGPEDDVQVEEFIEKAPIPKDEMLQILRQYVSEMHNPTIKAITSELIKRYKTQFLEYPAATKNHHEFFSGLAYHVVSMLKLATAIADLYPSLNRDLLYSGIILHDLGKVIELSGPIGTTYTVEGNLLGHISIMVNEIGKVAEALELEGEEVTVLQHIVLTHHGKPEWGSPKAPLIKEAEIIHYIDNLDAKMNMMDRALQRTNPGEFAERVFALENRAFYKPSFLE